MPPGSGAKSAKSGGNFKKEREGKGIKKERERWRGERGKKESGGKKKIKSCKKK